MTQVATLANLLTVLRLLLIPVFAAFVLYNDLPAALWIFLAAGITDALDGFVARHFHQSTPLGTILDPMADKLLVITAFVLLTLPDRGYQPIPLWLTITVISRDVFIVLGALTLFIVTGFRRFRPSIPGKIHTTIQVLTVAFVLAANIWGSLSELLRYMYGLSFAITIFSGVHYIYHAARLLEER
ncbi:MAG: CDP-alcohol phosphatidyltransferase family protein [Blastocatellia bacterium]|nr:CDP-alcohol phosphatidyltransferase family protein [Blastocatellia bacterium]MCS7157342.1 CDP-alcohol phosphatidyltransferase family protein [Blastocatellia bacterium]MCX7753208.1 CDP-alcohol phosphatidyltransferase family protein [Blastocatellia bacterium]MDW8168246.1 CDP-alcohol phosphatidyltransferase family protein [Acidobacteriota bacterium]MDW8255460.1 CDP-alcohol phosphatidyltransferase family protein [Acidobacteriota bacterium]